MILGESGAGKSTLLNALLGHEALATGEVRERGRRGPSHHGLARHGAPAGAGVIADVPGLRSLPLVGHERGLAKTFPEIADAAQGAASGTAPTRTSQAAPSETTTSAGPFPRSG